MHIPDGFLDARTAIATGALAAVGAGAALWRAKRSLDSRQVPLIGVTAAFVFAAQMLNFPVAGGTSGHLIGGTLAVALVGPTAAVIVMTAVLAVQCLLFQDGGLTALGANIFNMALLAPLVGGLVYRAMRRCMAGNRGLVVAGVLGGWGSTVAAAVSCAGQLAFSGTVAWGLAFPAMALTHVVIGIGEGVITGLVLAAVARTRPELVGRDAEPRAMLPATIGGTVVALGLALFVSPFACEWPDGLEKVAASLGFEHHAATTPVLPAWIPDYVMPGVDSPWLATALAGAVGTVIVLGVGWLLARSVIPGKKA